MRAIEQLLRFVRVESPPLRTLGEVITQEGVIYLVQLQNNARKSEWGFVFLHESTFHYIHMQLGNLEYPSWVKPYGNALAKSQTLLRILSSEQNSSPEPRHLTAVKSEVLDATTHITNIQPIHPSYSG